MQMCGATGAQTQLQDEQMQAYQQAQQMTAEQYADQQAVYAPLKAQFDKIFAAGPSQQGFSDEETNTLNAQAEPTASQPLHAGAPGGERGDSGKGRRGRVGAQRRRG